MEKVAASHTSDTNDSQQQGHDACILHLNSLPLYITEVPLGGGPLTGDGWVGGWVRGGGLAGW